MSMTDDERTQRLLEEIRDVQKESLAEYRRVTQQSLDMQRQAVTMAAAIVQLYRRVLLVGVVIRRSVAGAAGVPAVSLGRPVVQLTSGFRLRASVGADFRLQASAVLKKDGPDEHRSSGPSAVQQLLRKPEVGSPKPS
jgi:hypothetical protein